LQNEKVFSKLKIQLSRNETEKHSIQYESSL